ncbi:hypothetical protein SERLADRAFT_440683 [Serpula lacrymans var. lacrymans S7.9]|uniref:Uncharacterized protein n=1 Tax=Serpula lacrymans var. lacrymans (strain S7.9) TaxID=578457 RepID=F8P3D2_SERL9|nr:uncharacterized protein SERLADRAFT_440683 [Serpula lacrymans var. lacrymans S7.9]EGO22663.1 hypothetical protein SERLADRAFT_440683 [Serpula lacrymans var. lacrymans S7.9]
MRVLVGEVGVDGGEVGWRGDREGGEVERKVGGAVLLLVGVVGEVGVVRKRGGWRDGRWEGGGRRVGLLLGMCGGEESIEWGEEDDDGDDGDDDDEREKERRIEEISSAMVDSKVCSNVRCLAVSSAHSAKAVCYGMCTRSLPPPPPPPPVLVHGSLASVATCPLISSLPGVRDLTALRPCVRSGTQIRSSFNNTALSSDIRILTTHLTAAHGGSLAPTPTHRAAASFFFCSGPNDPWLSRFVHSFIFIPFRLHPSSTSSILASFGTLLFNPITSFS